MTERLREEIETLRAQLQAARNTPPQGSERYAGGDDVFDAKFEYWTGTGAWSSRQNREAIVRVTWNQIFYQLGPMLLEEASERNMSRRLTDELRKYDTNVAFAAGASPDNS